MARKRPVSLTDKQRAFARTLAENGGHTTVGALLEQIIDLLGGLLERAQSKDRRASRPTTAKRRSHGRPSRVPR